MSGLVDTNVNATDSSRKINKREQSKLGKGASQVKAGKGSKITIDGGSEKIAAIAKAALAERGDTARAQAAGGRGSGGFDLQNPWIIGGIVLLLVGGFFLVRK